MLTLNAVAYLKSLLNNDNMTGLSVRYALAVIVKTRKRVGPPKVNMKRITSLLLDTILVILRRKCLMNDKINKCLSMEGSLNVLIVLFPNVQLTNSLLGCKFHVHVLYSCL